MGTLVSPSLNKLVTNVRLMLNQPNRANSFWSDEELSAYINDAVRQYFVEVCYSDEGIFCTKTTLDIVANSETVAMPSDCFEIRVLRKRSGTTWVTLQYRNFTDDYNTQGGTTSDYFFPTYYLRGNNIVLHPVPNFSEAATLELEYLQFPDTMVDGGDTMSNQIAPIFKELIETYAIYKAKLKESLVTGVIVHQVAQQHLSSLAVTFRDAIQRRAKTPVYTEPFNPE